MLKIEKFVTASPEQMEMIIEGMRNPMNSWDRMDSFTCCEEGLTIAELEEKCGTCPKSGSCDVFDYRDVYILGPNDHQLMMSLAKGGPVHAKYRRMMPIWVTITAPLYWWKEFDTYKVGTVANSCSTMHKIHAKEFEIWDFSFEKLIGKEDFCWENDIMAGTECRSTPLDILEETIHALNIYREKFLQAKTKPMKDESKRAGLMKKYWWQMIQLLPTSYNQTRTVFMNYEVAYAMRKDRRFHKLDEWHVLCDFLESLPYSEVSAPEV